MSNSPILPGANGGDDDGSNPPISLKSALEERYLAYALSTIMHRALPDVRDGLKPVHRRVLYAMRELRLAPDSPFTKSAKVVGEVMGNYHPHGDQAIYDALVRLAQDFAQRYPLVDGQGNFGNIDGDNAAAMRYTESRLTAVAALLLEDIDADTVDFRETYDGKGQEPAVLPANFPNLLANGSSGIAVGMATSIPPHNAAELCDAALYLIDHPDADTNALVALVPGPDFPTGGVLVDDHATITEAYRTGRGSFRVRARWSVEDLGRGGWQIVVTEIPYQVQKSRLIERIAELIENKRAPLLGDVRDESAEDVRIVLEPKARTVEPVVLMESLYKLTELEARIPLNMNVLTRGQVPNVIGLKQVLREWLDHRKVVLVRRSQHRLKAIDHRLEVLDGYLIAYLNIDEVIRIIREEDEPKRVMMARFGLTDVQAEAILNMRLRALRKLEEFEIRTEHQKLSDERAALIALLADDAKQWATISGEIRKTRERFGKNTPLGKRRTGFDSVADVDVNLTEAMIEKAPVTIVLSDKGWIRAMRGHLETAEGLSFKADDSLKAMVTAQTTDKLVLFASNGKFFTLAADKLPGGRGHGEPVRLLIDLEQDHDILALFVHQPGRKLLIASRDGYGFVAPEEDLVAMTKKGKQVLNLAEGDRAARVVAAKGDTVAVIGENRKMLIFPATELAELARGRGTRLQKFREGGLADVKLFAATDGLTWRDASGRTNTLKDFAEWQGARGSAGKPVPKGFSRSGTFGEPGL